MGKKAVSELDGIVGYIDFRVTENERKRLSEKGYYCYETRHSDYDMADPATIENRVMVNFLNTVITSKPLPIPEGGYIEIAWDLDNDSEIEVEDLLQNP